MPTDRFAQRPLAIAQHLGNVKVTQFPFFRKDVCFMQQASSTPSKRSALADPVASSVREFVKVADLFNLGIPVLKELTIPGVRETPCADIDDEFLHYLVRACQAAEKMANNAIMFLEAWGAKIAEVESYRKEGKAQEK
jgi:hypothetical protein